jgi:hypothetical protein
MICGGEGEGEGEGGRGAGDDALKDLGCSGSYDAVGTSMWPGKNCPK